MLRGGTATCVYFTDAFYGLTVKNRTVLTESFSSSPHVHTHTNTHKNSDHDIMDSSSDAQ